MSKLKPISYALLALAVLSTAGFGAMSQPQGAVASQASGEIIAQAQPTAKQSKFNGFFVPKGRALPKDSEGGASRGRCMQNHAGIKEAVTLLTPAGNSGLTALARPTFIANIDQTSANQVFFSLKNEDESYFFEMITSLPSGNSSLVTFPLPETAPPLEMGEQYRWSVAVICGSKLGPDSPWASGWVERVEAVDQEFVEALQPLEQASFYGKAGLWYDTVAVLANHRENDGVDADAAWVQLLNEGGITADIK